MFYLNVSYSISRSQKSFTWNWFFRSRLRYNYGWKSTYESFSFTSLLQMQNKDKFVSHNNKIQCSVIDHIFVLLN